MLDFDDVALGYQGQDTTKTVLENVSFSVSDDVILGIVGASGIGKSTLLKAVAGTLEPLRGVIRPGDASAGNQVWFLPQTPVLIPFRTTLQNALFAREISNRLTRRDISDACEILSGLGLAQEEATLPSALSGGMRRRVALAQGLLSTRPILLLDEPLAELDYDWRLRTERLIHQSWRHVKKTCLLASHDLDSIVALSHVVLVLQGPPPATTALVEMDDLAIDVSLSPDERRQSPGFAAAVAHFQKMMLQREGS